MRHCFNLPSTFFSCVVIVLVTAAAAEVREVAQEQILFDFRDVVMPDPDPLGFPEITYFATTHGERHPPFYSLPIELAIESISRTAGVTDLVSRPQTGARCCHHRPAADTRYRAGNGEA